jgi:hypothetical protein
MIFLPKMTFAVQTFASPYGYCRCHVTKIAVLPGCQPAHRLLSCVSISPIIISTPFLSTFLLFLLLFFLSPSTKYECIVSRPLPLSKFHTLFHLPFSSASGTTRCTHFDSLGVSATRMFPHYSWKQTELRQPRWMR